jgi:hypothetical protein
MQDLATPNVERTIPFATRIQPSLKREVEARAAAEERSIRVIVERALRAYVATHAEEASCR